MTVVELWPFGGWYTEIIAPYLKGTGTYYAAAQDPSSNDAEDKELNAKLKALLDSRPDLYGGVKWSVLAKGKYNLAPDGSADMVVTFRNIHNWVWSGYEKDVFAAAFRALKPGGILGVEEHRNNNPKDTKNYPKGVWTLPPSYAEGDKDRAKYAAIGESDRFTLKFVKPAQ
jgi:predicted methyltransferase